MRIYKPQILFLLFLTIAVSVWSGIVSHRVEVIKIEINDRNDTAQISTIHTLTIVDSFDYIDTFSYQYDTGAHQTIKWTSAVQQMIITPTVDTASAYACSVGFATDTLGIVFDASLTAPVLDSLIDSLVAQLNAVVGLTDSIDFQDSVTYIKVVSLFGQRKFTARWKCEFGITGGAGTIDTASHASLITMPMVVDSLVAAINADAGLDSFMTAANSGDTGYTITSDDKGVLFYATTVNHADTGGTLAATQANITSLSFVTDTFKLQQTVYYDRASLKSMYAVFILNASLDSLQGVGLSDSGYLWLYSAFSTNNSTIEYLLLDSALNNSLPCTLRYSLSSDSAFSDTIIREALYLGYRISDTASDTNLYNPSYNLNLDYNLYEK